MPTRGRAATYETPKGPALLQSHRLRPPAAGEALVRFRMATICRSDIHAWHGHRPYPRPGVPGHEIIGSIVALGAGVTPDMRGDSLAPGRRITGGEYFDGGPGGVATMMASTESAAGKRVLCSAMTPTRPLP